MLVIINNMYIVMDSDSLNIAHVTSRYLPAPLRGPERYIQNISEGLVKRGHQVTVLVSNAFKPESYINPFRKRVSARCLCNFNGVYIKRFRNAYEIKLPLNIFELIMTSIGIRNSVLSVIARGPFTPELFFHIIKTSYDIVHATCFPYVYVWLAWLAARKAEIPFIVTPFLLSIKDPQDRYLMSILTNSDGIIVPTNLEKKRLIKLGVPSKKIHFMPIPINVKKYRNADGEKFRKIHGIDASPMILFIGPKEYNKGAIHLLRAMYHVQKIINDVVLVACGPYTKRWVREKEKLNNISLIDLPWIDGQDKVDAFDACDIFVMPSRSEALGIVYLEAWASRKPVIGARVDPMPEIIRDGVNGFLVNFGDETELAQSIINLLKNPTLCEKLGLNGRNNVAVYDSRKVCDRIEEIYQSIICSHQQSITLS